MSLLLLLLLLLSSASAALGLQCFVDVDGIKRGDDDGDRAELLDRFKKQNCSQYTTGKVEKVRRE